MQPETAPDGKMARSVVFYWAGDVYRGYYTSTASSGNKNKTAKHRTGTGKGRKRINLCSQGLQRGLKQKS
jgi:hypothetical protein